MSDDFRAIYRRILQVTGTNTQTELAALFKVRQSSISDALSRGSLPSGWLVKLVEQHNVHPNWIKSGEGPQYLVPCDTPSSEVPLLRDYAASLLLAELARRLETGAQS